MASRRTLVDVEDFNRRRGVAALLRGDSLDLEEVPPRPNAAIAGGVIIALLVGGASVAGAYLSGRTPDGWRGDGTLVLDESTGARYVAEDEVLRPAPTLTAALLAGARPAPVLVPHDAVAAAPVGAALPGGDLPESPPTLPARASGFTACFQEPAVEVYATVPTITPAAAEAVLVATPATPDGAAVLVAGRLAHPVSAAAITALGYSPAQVRQVPRAWLDLVPTGPDLDLLSPRVDPARGLEGIGVAGEVVEEAGTGRRFLVGEDSLAPFVNATSQALAPPPVRQVPRAAVTAAPAAPPTGIIEAPTAPPTIPAREEPAVPCVDSSPSAVLIASAVTDTGTIPTPGLDLGGTQEGKAPDGTGGDGAVEVRWHFRPGHGALVGPTTLDAAPVPEQQGTGGIRVIDAGIAYPVQDLPALGVLGYRREETVLLADAWLALTARGAPIASSR